MKILIDSQLPAIHSSSEMLPIGGWGCPQGKIMDFPRESGDIRAAPHARSASSDIPDVPDLLPTHR